MKTPYCRNIIMVALVVLLAAPALAGWKEKITTNQLAAKAYIEELIDGADPDELERPHMRRDERFKAKKANREIVDAMEEAERLAREGKHEQIEEPVFEFEGVPEDKYKKMQEEN